MRPNDFHHWLSRASELTPSQREQALASLSGIGHVGDVIAAIADWEPRCPHCLNTNCNHWGSAHGLPRYRCRACHRTFNALTATPLARLRHRERWARYAQALIDGTSVREAARRCDVHKDTAFRWRHRFLSLPARCKPTHLHGIVEADETYFLESHKGERHLPRAPRRRGGVATKRGLSHEQIPVLIARDRDQSTTDAVLPKADSQSVGAVLAPLLDGDAVLCSDANAIYSAFARQAHLAHRPINLSQGIRVVDHAFHIQNVNAYDSRLKGWMARFHGVATKYLSNYLGWRRCLERFAQNLSPTLLIAQAAGVEQHLTQT